MPGEYLVGQPTTFQNTEQLPRNGTLPFQTVQEIRGTFQNANSNNSYGSKPSQVNKHANGTLVTYTHSAQSPSVVQNINGAAATRGDVREHIINMIGLSSVSGSRVNHEQDGNTPLVIIAQQAPAVPTSTSFVPVLTNAEFKTPGLPVQSQARTASKAARHDSSQNPSFSKSPATASSLSKDFIEFIQSPKVPDRFDEEEDQEEAKKFWICDAEVYKKDQESRKANGEQNPIPNNARLQARVTSGARLQFQPINSNVSERANATPVLQTVRKSNIQIPPVVVSAIQGTSTVAYRNAIPSISTSKRNGIGVYGVPVMVSPRMQKKVNSGQHRVFENKGAGKILPNAAHVIGTNASAICKAVNQQLLTVVKARQSSSEPQQQISPQPGAINAPKILSANANGQKVIRQRNSFEAAKPEDVEPPLKIVSCYTLSSKVHDEQKETSSPVATSTSKSLSMSEVVKSTWRRKSDTILPPSEMKATGPCRVETHSKPLQRPQSTSASYDDSITKAIAKASALADKHSTEMRNLSKTGKPLKRPNSASSNGSTSVGMSSDNRNNSPELKHNSSTARKNARMSVKGSENVRCSPPSSLESWFSSKQTKSLDMRVVGNYPAPLIISKKPLIKESALVASANSSALAVMRFTSVSSTIGNIGSKLVSPERNLILPVTTQASSVSSVSSPKARSVSSTIADIGCRTMSPKNNHEAAASVVTSSPQSKASGRKRAPVKSPSSLSVRNIVWNVSQSDSSPKSLYYQRQAQFQKPSQSPMQNPHLLMSDAQPVETTPLRTSDLPATQAERLPQSVPQNGPHAPLPVAKVMKSPPSYTAAIQSRSSGPNSLSDTNGALLDDSSSELSEAVKNPDQSTVEVPDEPLDYSMATLKKLERGCLSPEQDYALDLSVPKNAPGSSSLQVCRRNVILSYGQAISRVPANISSAAFAKSGPTASSVSSVLPPPVSLIPSPGPHNVGMCNLETLCSVALLSPYEGTRLEAKKARRTSQRPRKKDKVGGKRQSRKKRSKPVKVIQRPESVRIAEAVNVGSGQNGDETLAPGKELGIGCYLELTRREIGGNTAETTDTADESVEPDESNEKGGFDSVHSVDNEAMPRGNGSRETADAGSDSVRYKTKNTDIDGSMDSSLKRIRVESNEEPSAVSEPIWSSVEALNRHQKLPTDENRSVEQQEQPVKEVESVPESVPSLEICVEVSLEKTNVGEAVVDKTNGPMDGENPGLVDNSPSLKETDIPKKSIGREPSRPHEEIVFEKVSGSTEFRNSLNEVRVDEEAAKKVPQDVDSENLTEERKASNEMKSAVENDPSTDANAKEGENIAASLKESIQDEYPRKISEEVAEDGVLQIKTVVDDFQPLEQTNVEVLATSSQTDSGITAQKNALLDDISKGRNSPNVALLRLNSDEMRNNFSVTSENEVINIRPESLKTIIRTKIQESKLSGTGIHEGDNGEPVGSLDKNTQGVTNEEKSCKVTQSAVLLAERSAVTADVTSGDDKTNPDGTTTTEPHLPENVKDTKSAETPIVVTEDIKFKSQAGDREGLLVGRETPEEVTPDRSDIRQEVIRKQQCGSLLETVSTEIENGVQNVPEDQLPAEGKAGDEATNVDEEDPAGSEGIFLGVRTPTRKQFPRQKSFSESQEMLEMNEACCDEYDNMFLTEDESEEEVDEVPENKTEIEKEVDQEFKEVAKEVTTESENVPGENLDGATARLDVKAETRQEHASAVQDDGNVGESPALKGTIDIVPEQGEPSDQLVGGVEKRELVAPNDWEEPNKQSPNLIPVEVKEEWSDQASTSSTGTPVSMKSPTMSNKKFGYGSGSNPVRRIGYNFHADLSGCDIKIKRRKLVKKEEKPVEKKVTKQTPSPKSSSTSYILLSDSSDSSDETDFIKTKVPDRRLKRRRKPLGFSIPRVEGKITKGVAPTSESEVSQKPRPSNANSGDKSSQSLKNLAGKETPVTVENMSGASSNVLDMSQQGSDVALRRSSRKRRLPASRPAPPGAAKLKRPVKMPANKKGVSTIQKVAGAIKSKYSKATKKTSPVKRTVKPKTNQQKTKPESFKPLPDPAVAKSVKQAENDAFPSFSINGIAPPRSRFHLSPSTYEATSVHLAPSPVNSEDSDFQTPNTIRLKSFVRDPYSPDCGEFEDIRGNCPVGNDVSSGARIGKKDASKKPPAKQKSCSAPKRKPKFQILKLNPMKGLQIHTNSVKNQHAPKQQGHRRFLPVPRHLAKDSFGDVSLKDVVDEIIRSSPMQPKASVIQAPVDRSKKSKSPRSSNTLVSKTSRSPFFNLKSYAVESNRRVQKARMKGKWKATKLNNVTKISAPRLTFLQPESLSKAKRDENIYLTMQKLLNMGLIMDQMPRKELPSFGWKSSFDMIGKAYDANRALVANDQARSWDQPAALQRPSFHHPPIVERQDPAINEEPVWVAATDATLKPCSVLLKRLNLEKYQK